jgi:hypothetical protein
MSSISSSCLDGYGNLTMHQQVSSTSNFYNQNNINNNNNSHRSCFPNGSTNAYANDWTGVPLIKSNSSSSTISSEPHAQQQQRYHKKNIYSTRSNGFEFDENSMSRLAKHTQGAPIIMSNSNRYRSNKPIKTMQSSFNHENCGSRNFSSSNNSSNNHSNTNNNNNTNYVTVTKQQPITSSTSTVATPESCSMIESENQNYEDAGYNSNGTCLPRIIKPRKRRKKDRKPVVSVDINPPTQHLQTTKNSYPFTFASNQSSNGYLQSMTSSNNNNNNIGVSNGFNATTTLNSGENYTRPMPLNDMNLFFNNDFELNSANPAQTSSSASSPISLSNSSLSSSSATTSSCSCRLCDPNCRIWAFPLRRSFSDNSATELDRHNDGLHFESMPLNGSNKKDVGVIGGNRVKTEQTHSNHHDSSYTLFDMIEYENYQNKQQSQHNLIMDRLRSESLSDSGDSGCDLLLGNLNISDEILSSTLETMSDGLTDEGLTAITQKLSEFNILPSPNCSENSSSDGLASSNRLFVGENINFNSNECITVDLDNRQHRVNSNNNNNNHSNLNLATFNTNINTKSSSSSSRYTTCDFIGNNLQSLLALDSVSSSRMTSVGNQNLMSPTLVNRQNSNNLDFNNNNNPASVCNNNSIEGLKERTLFDCFNNMTWTRP